MGRFCIRGNVGAKIVVHHSSMLIRVTRSCGNDVVIHIAYYKSSSNYVDTVLKYYGILHVTLIYVCQSCDIKPIRKRERVCGYLLSHYKYGSRSAEGLGKYTAIS